MQHRGKHIIKYLKRGPGYPKLRIKECNLSNSAFFIDANEREETEEFAETRGDLCKIFLKLPDGLPSHDTFDRMFSLIDPVALPEHFGLRKCNHFQGTTIFGISPGMRLNLLVNNFTYWVLMTDFLCYLKFILKETIHCCRCFKSISAWD